MSFKLHSDFNPFVTTSQAETSVMVKDGVTIIIGGLQKEQRSKSVSKIPLLGDIPGLGHLFRKTSDELTKTELVILLTPYIMPGEDSFSDFSEIRPKDGAVAKMVKGNIITEKVVEAEKDNNREYYRLVSDKIRTLTLFNQPRGITGNVEVFFILDSQGQLKGKPWVISSNNDNLNNIAIECIKKASPFPAFPKELKKTEEGFRIALEYK